MNAAGSIRRLALAWLGVAALSLPLAGLWRALAVPAVTPAAFPVAFYQHVAPGRVDGRSCPSWPVCSAYARRALARHGLLVGSWLVLDRLIHEGGDLARGPVVRAPDGLRVYDPLSRNDFWLKERMR